MKIPSVKGFHDILPEECARWSWLESQSRACFSRYGFGEIRLPMLERSEVFKRSIGDATDIVEKEMYTFEDRDGTQLSLRPEGTASVVRAFVEHAMQQQAPVAKLFYFGPMFRRERPQRGRLRQFAQVGAEVIGRDDPALDAEVLLLLGDLLEGIGLRDARLELNSLGCGDCRPQHREALLAFGRAHHDALCDNCRSRLERNPLRLLDCKNPSCGELTEAAPQLPDHLCDACRGHFARVRGVLDREQVAYRLAPRLVRGLDYYCRTAFEVVADGLGAQNAVGGGGRYDGLVRRFGGPDTAGIGFALGIERLLLALGDQAGGSLDRPEVVLVPLGEAAEDEALHLAHRWRGDGVRVELTSGSKSLKSQMRLADRSGAPFVLILGEDELTAGAATVRDMCGKRDFPREIALTASAADLRAALDRLGQRSGETGDA